MTAVVLRADARRLPLPDGCVDLICTSPPYFGLRSYTDGCSTCSEVTRQKIPGYTERRCADCGNLEQGRMRCNRCGGRTVRTDAARATGRADCPDCGGTGSAHYDGQIGSEATPAEWLASLVECTREWVRVLKPPGSIFVNLGDKYGASLGSNHGTGKTTLRDFGPKTGKAPVPNVRPFGTPKSLLGLPWRYALACMDELGLILRRDIIWSKPNGLPESVTDRCRSSHEYVFHLVKQPRYYAAVDEIREPHLFPDQTRTSPKMARHSVPSDGNRVGRQEFKTLHPLGKLPGSVWRFPDDEIWDIPSQPLQVPAHLGIDHFAAFPLELPRRIIAGWSPPGICTACGEGRRPVVDRHPMPKELKTLDHRSTTYKGARTGNHGPGRGDAEVNIRGQEFNRWRSANPETITGYACACTPYTDHEGPRREYHFGAWNPAPTGPAIVLDPFAGTGTTMLAASALGRAGIGCDLSMDYARLARWRTQDRAEIAKAMQVPKPPPVPDGQEALFT